MTKQPQSKIKLWALAQGAETLAKAKMPMAVKKLLMGYVKKEVANSSEAQLWDMARKMKIQLEELGV